MLKGRFSAVASPNAVFMTGTIPKCPRAHNAHPYSMSTFGFGINRPFSVLPTRVRSGTKTVALEIFWKITSAIGGVQGTSFVSLSNTRTSSRTAFSISMPVETSLIAFFRASSINVRLVDF